MSARERDPITRLLRRPAAEVGADPLLDAVYEQLMAIARRRMARERADHTLQPTALVHEAFVRLQHRDDVEWQDRGHFFAAAAEAMRRILVEHARRRGTEKRGGGRRHVPIDVLDLAAHATGGDILALEEAMERLEREDPRAAAIVRLRFYAGLDVADTATAMGLSVRTVHREWAFARARLFQLFHPDAEAPR